jgi:CheY-like chemotaxis protein/tetratricopeptide (TPR) repeat protein
VTKSILVVEDDSSVAGLLEDVLSREGFDVRAEADGEWGLRAFTEGTPDLVILDVLLPKLQGFDLITKLRAAPGGAKVPLVVISGVFRRNLYERQLMERHKITAYLDKPLDVDALLDVLHDVFSSGYPEPRPRASRLPSILTRAPARATPAAPEQAVALPGKGDLREVPFARLLGTCFRARATGALMLRRATVKKIVYFKEGVPVFVRSNLLTECLGRVMVEERLISQRECEQSLERKRKEPDKRQGEILVEMGSISQHNLQFALELQMQAKLFEIFSWQEFNQHGDYDGPQVALSMSPTALIHEGSLRGMSAERIRRDLSQVADGPLLPSRDPTFRYQALQLDPRAERLLDLMDGSRSAPDLIDSGVADPDDAAFLVYALVATGLLYAPPPPPAMKVEETDLEVLGTGEIEVPPELADAAPRAPSTAGKALARALAANARFSQAPGQLPRAASTPPPPPPPDAEDEAALATEGQTEADEASAALEAAADDEGWADDEAGTLASGDEDATPEPEDGAAAAASLEDDGLAAADPDAERERGGSRAGGAAPPLSPDPAPELDGPGGADGPGDDAAERAGPRSDMGLQDDAWADDADDAEASPDVDPAEEETPVPAVTALPQPTPAPEPAPPPELEAPRASRLPRASRWGKTPSGELPAAERPASTLSPSLREEVRARLEVEAHRLATLRPPPEAKPGRRRGASRKALGLDLDQERARLEVELEADLARLTEQDHYARLELSPGADAEEIARAFERLTRRFDPERITAGLRSPQLRLLAERRVLLLTRAQATLLDPAARRRYHARLGLERAPDDAPLVRADDAFEAGRRAARHEAWAEAREAFAEAVAKDPEEGVYLSHLAWATHAAAPEDPEAREQALELLRRAAELNPRHEEVYLFAGRIQQRQGRREAALQAFQRALRCNPDCVEALAAVRELTPPPAKKGGLFSRLSAR